MEKWEQQECNSSSYKTVKVNTACYNSFVKKINYNILHVREKYFLKSAITKTILYCTRDLKNDFFIVICKNLMDNFY